MGYSNLRDCLADLERTGQLVRLDVEIDPHLEAAEIQRRVYQAQGPAVYFARLKGCRFPAVSNLFGTLARARYLFRDTLDAGPGKGTGPAPRSLGRGEVDGLNITETFRWDPAGNQSRPVELGQQPEASLASSASNPAGEA